MREDSHRGAPRSARAPGRPGAGRDTRTPRTASRDPGAAFGVQQEAGRASASPARGAGRPAQKGAADTARLTSVIEPVLAAMEIDLEAVKLSAAGRRVVLRIVVDADGGVSLDDIAEVSRELSAKLDAKNAMGDAPYTLEVTSPGTDRPLTQPRHWRRAAGRLVVFESAAAELKGRVVVADREGVTLDFEGERRTFSFDELGPGRVQVEFGRLNEIDEPDDLETFPDAEDSTQATKAGGSVGSPTSPTRAGKAGGSGGSPTRASEEEPDGH
jgi:ribosome maturation factor RimP